MGADGAVATSVINGEIAVIATVTVNMPKLGTLAVYARLLPVGMPAVAAVIWTQCNHHKVSSAMRT